MECLRCGNKDPTYFYKGHRGYYCRKCIKFSRIVIEEELEPLDYKISDDASEYEFSYQLTNRQLQASLKCLDILLEKKDVLLHCVCGAGKTEISVKAISYYLSKGLKVAYAIARKEVVIDLCERFKKIFPKANVTSVYGGHHNNIYGDLIVCTCHQLYRYYHTFDLLVLDEVDAFPLKGNDTLMNISLNSCAGNIIFSTATIDDALRKVLEYRNYETVQLFTRPSLKPLVIPKIVYLNKVLIVLYLYKLMHSMTNQCIIFVSSKTQCEYMYRIFSHLFSCTYVYSDLEKRNENIIGFKNKKYKYIFATTVLERGITIKDVNVIIINIGKVFDESNIIQMLGRVGRNINNPFGEAYILSDHYDKNVTNSIDYLEYANSKI